MTKKKKSLFLSFFHFFYRKNNPKVRKITREEYRLKFLEGRSDVQLEATYKKAWEAKNFEIDNYWKRANYFWAFQVASFAGYFTVLGSKAYPLNPQVLFFVVCIGLITTHAWVLINIGSKTWQRHWENHVDLLEDKVTGPLYKVTTTTKTYSVSKINEIVSKFIFCIWVILAGKYLFENNTIRYTDFNHIDFQVIISVTLTASFIFAMHFGKGRGRFGKRKVELYERILED
jgi:hypothetical protein